MRKIGIFTTFFEAESGYSLVAVAENQIRMLLDHGYQPVVLVQGQYNEDEHGNVLSPIPFREVPPPSVWNRQTVDLREAIPPLKLTPDVAKDFDERVKQIVLALQGALADVDVCITHDVVLQEFYKEHNVAVRQYARARPDLLWLHWIHSCPTSSGRTESYPNHCRYTPPPGYVVYPNASDKPRVVGVYGLAGQEHRVQVCRAAHAIDPLLAWPYDGLTKDLARKADLLGGDVAVVYPARLDRGKQVEKIVRLMVGVKRAGYDPRLLVVDWQSAGPHFQEYIDELIDLAESYAIGHCVHFTSRLDDRCSQGVPQQVVMELTDLSNVYVHPSAIETYSLVVHQAMLRGKLCVLNHDLHMMRELYGDAAIYMDFGSDQVTRSYHPNEQQFWNDEALRLLAELRQNRAVVAQAKARHDWTPQALWSEFAPLLGLEPVGE